LVAGCARIRRREGNPTGERLADEPIRARNRVLRTRQRAFGSNGTRRETGVELTRSRGEIRRTDEVFGPREISGDHQDFSKSSAGENEVTERSSDHEVMEILSEGFARALRIEPGIGGELFGARHQSGRSATSTRGASEGASHRARLFGACARRITSDDAFGVGAQRNRNGGGPRTSEASGTRAHDFRSLASHHRFLRGGPRTPKADRRRTRREAPTELWKWLATRWNQGSSELPALVSSVRELELGSKKRESAHTLGAS
jgi:hypothetical protein